MYTINSNYRISILTDIKVECSFLRVGLRKFSFPPKMTLYPFIFCPAHIVLCFIAGDNEIINYVSRMYIQEGRKSKMILLESALAFSRNIM